MSLLKSLANSLEEEKKVEERKERQLATNPFQFHLHLIFLL